MRLMRLVLLRFERPEKGWTTWPGGLINEVEVVSSAPRVFNSDHWEILSAITRVRGSPHIDVDGALVIADEDRNRAEAALEAVANMLAVARERKRLIYSPQPCIGIRPDDPDERRLLARVIGTRAQRRAATPHGVKRQLRLDAKLIRGLESRLDGVALLAEALAHDHPTGRLHELMRVFERGFHRASSPLVDPLTDFLGGMPAYGYSRAEIKSWILDIRHPATHADRRDFILQATTQRVIPRMLQAAYDVVLNKAEWHSPSAKRRQLWIPGAITIGPRQEDGIASLPGVPLSPTFSVFDEFGSYPLTGPDTVPFDRPPGWIFCQADQASAGSMPLQVRASLVDDVGAQRPNPA